MNDATVHTLPLAANADIPPRDQREWITTYELIADSGITYRQADYWCRTRLLVPLEDANPGSGHLRRFPLEEITRARTLRDLLNAGVSLQTCRQILDEVLTTGSATVGAVTITRPTATGDPAA